MPLSLCPPQLNAVRRRAPWLILLVSLVLAACSGAGYQPKPDDVSGPVHGESGGGSGGSM